MIIGLMYSSGNEELQGRPVNIHKDINSTSSSQKKANIHNFYKEIEKQEVLDTDSIWLNDAIPFLTSQKEVLCKLGKPDFITTPNFECGAYIAGEEPWGDTVNVWHYKGTKLVAFKDKATIMVIKIRGWDCTLHHPRIIFSGYTTLEDVAEVFPLSVQKVYNWEDVSNGKVYQVVSISTIPNSDDKWHLKFFQNKLVEIEHWTPC